MKILLPVQNFGNANCGLHQQELYCKIDGRDGSDIILMSKKDLGHSLERDVGKNLMVPRLLGSVYFFFFWGTLGFFL